MMQLLAKTFQGLEDILASEIKDLGGVDIRPLKRAVAFRGDRKLLYKVNLRAATALRVLVHLFEFPFHNQQEYYRNIKDYKWEGHLPLSKRFAIDAIAQSRIFPHTRMAVYKAKDAIVDRFRKRTGRRPGVAVQGEDLRIHIFVKDKLARVYLDSSGSSLHLRGYRLRAGSAPLNEVLAAGIIRLTGWDGRGVLIDPMCGSGTIPIEAAFMASHRPVNAERDFGFMKWLNFDVDLWKSVREEAYNAIVDPGVEIWGGDRNRSIITMAQLNAEKAGVAPVLNFCHRDMKDWRTEKNEGTLIFNPPYDKRLNEADIRAFYKNIGDMLKQHWTGYTAWMLSGNMEAIKFVGLKASRRIPLFNGALDSRLLKYEMYRGKEKK